MSTPLLIVAAVILLIIIILLAVLKNRGYEYVDDDSSSSDDDNKTDNGKGKGGAKEDATKQKKSNELPLLFKEVVVLDQTGMDEKWKVYMGIFKNASRYRFENYVSAIYRDMRLKRCDVTVKRGPGGRKDKVIFEGTFNEFTLRNTISQEILVISKSYMGLLIGARTSDTSFTDQIGFKDNPLAIHYSIFAADNDSAIRILTPEFFEALKRIERALDTSVVVHILGRRMLIAINDDDTNFNPAIINAMKTNSKAYKELYVDFRRMLNVVDSVRDKFPTLSPQNSGVSQTYARSRQGRGAQGSGYRR